ncbi:MAG: segregation/condensation protein A [Clostridia bacterium]|nr:segregation/condensation protein A [Clostridia bacterium]
MVGLNLKLEQYEGPLDLLLSLIQKHKIDIFDIPIAELTDQYLEYIESVEKYDMQVSSDFIFMASELMYIKSRMLLPVLPKDEDPRQPLVDALLEYSRAKQASKFLKTQSDIYYDRFVKDPDVPETPPVYERRHSVELLTEAFINISRRMPSGAEQRVELFEKLRHEKFYTVEEKTAFTLKFLGDGKRHRFGSLFEDCRTVGETVATFLALLSLVGNGRIEIFRGDSGDPEDLDLVLLEETEVSDEQSAD